MTIDHATRAEKNASELPDRVPSAVAGDVAWLPTIIMVAFFVYFMIPLAWLVISSTKNNADLFGTFGFWFSGTFQPVPQHPCRLRLLQRRLRPLDAQLAHLCHRQRSRGVIPGHGGRVRDSPSTSSRPRGSCFGVVLGAIAVPATALAIPTYLLFSKIGHGQHALCDHPAVTDQPHRALS